nr:relaxin receptor 2-like [Penaeus vannamei]
MGHLQGKKGTISPSQVHSFLITNLALGDLCMGIYLLIIAAVDVNYRGVYFIYDALWRTSSLCQLAGFLSTFSSELSVFTLTENRVLEFTPKLIREIAVYFHTKVLCVFPLNKRLVERGTSKRYFVRSHHSGKVRCHHLPFSRESSEHELDEDHNGRGVGICGRAGCSTALQHSLFQELLREVGCLPRPSHHTREAEWWQYSVFVFLALNLISFSVIAASYWGMYRAARTTSAAVIRSDQQRRDSNMAKKMTLIVVTDAACWLPIILLGFVSLAGGRIPPQVFAWVAVFVLPLNAAVNPLLYTLSTAPFLGKARERGVGRATLLQEVDHSAYPVTTTVIPINSTNINHQQVTTTFIANIQQCLPPTTNQQFPPNNSNVYHQHFLLTTISTTTAMSTTNTFLLTTISTNNSNVSY